MDTQQSAGPAAFIDVLRMMKQCSQKITFYVVRAGRWHIYYIKLQFSLSVCLSVPLPPFSTRSSDRNQIWHIYSGRYGTHSDIKKFYPPHPRGVPWGCWGVFRGSKNQKTGKCHELPRKSTKKVKTRWGVGWGGSFRGHKIKSPGSVMNCPENQYKKC